MVIQSELRTLKNALLDLFFPPVCTFCSADDVEFRSLFLCASCWNSLRWVDQPFCGICGLPLSGSVSNVDEICSECVSRPPVYERARVGVAYEGPLRDGLVKFKYGGALDAGKTLAQIIVEVFRRNYRSGDIDLIVPMPIHRNRLVERGFSQTLLLAGAISRESSIPVDHSSFCKLKDTPAQAGLSRDERVRNLKGSFHVRRPDRIRGRRVLLIDDVATTGSTIREASAALVSASPASLQVLALAFRKWSDAPDESQSLVQSGVL